MLADGTYDAMVVDATAGPDDTIALELAILAGDHKGEMVTVHARGLGRDALDLLAVPATLEILAGRPSVHLEG